MSMLTADYMTIHPTPGRGVTASDRVTEFATKAARPELVESLTRDDKPACPLIEQSRMTNEELDRSSMTDPAPKPALKLDTVSDELSETNRKQEKETEAAPTTKATAQPAKEAKETCNQNLQLSGYVNPKKCYCNTDPK